MLSQAFEKPQIQNDIPTTSNVVYQPVKNDSSAYPRTSTAVLSIQSLQGKVMDTKYDEWAQRLAQTAKKIKLRGTDKKLAGITAGMLLTSPQIPLPVHYNVKPEAFAHEELMWFPVPSDWLSYAQQQYLEQPEVLIQNVGCNCGNC